MEEKVHDVLAQYHSDEVMLDAFFQWASGQFRSKGEGKHAWAQEKAYVYFLDNLRLRYGVSAADAKGIGIRLEEECKALIGDSSEFEVKSAVKAVLSGPTGDILRKNVQLKVDRASVSARGLLAVYNWLGGFPGYQSSMSSTAWAGPLEALYRVTLGALPGSEVKSFAAARDELIWCGVINKSFYESSSGKTSYDEYLPGILVPQKIDLASVAPAVDANSISTYLQALFTRQAFEQARILEEVALHGVTTYDVYGKGELPGEVIPHRGLFAYIDAERGKVAAVNPLGREILLKNIVELKTERLKNTGSSIETALERFRDEAWPESDLTLLSDRPDRRVWRLDQIGAPKLFIFIGNWLSESDLDTIRNLGAEPLRDAFMFALTDQSLLSIKKVIAHSLKMWEKASITVITPTPNGMASHQLQGTVHPSLSHILELLGVQTPPPIVPPPPPPIEPPPPPPPTPPVLKDVIRVGNIENHQQHGVLGRLGEQNVVLDLYEPHAVSILGVQGSGKSYAAGAIIEMSVNPIPSLSELRKPLSCIIFHFSKEEKRVPEWIGLAEENSSDIQIQKLKRVYGASPFRVHASRVNILVPPTKVAERTQQYRGFNVLPLLFSPSRLKADDWKRLLTFGKGSDALYMEALGEIMIDLRAKKANFGADDLTDEIKRSELNTSQKRFALQRIKTIGRWLSEERSPFIELVKPGVVNIVDLRDPLAVDERMASLVLQTVFSFVKDRPSDEICLVAIDEAHLFFEHENLTKEIVEFVALLRKDYKVYLLLMSQHPRKFHPDILGLCDLIICHRLESDFELDFLEKTKPDFESVRNKIKKLRTKEGEAFMWARVSTNDIFAQPKLISVRPKCTEDKGKTATAF
jgi:hypothetical protein